MENEEKKDKVFELVMGENDMIDGVSTISFVEHPAHESEFMYFSKQEESFKFAKEGEKMMVFGAALIPDMKILRLDKDENPYHVFFSKETIAKSQELFFKRAQHNNSNVEHMFAIDGVSVVESWIIEDNKNDKSNAMGFNLPNGTWMVGYKIDNEQLWEGIKDGSVKGFSIEGKFIEELVKMNSEEVEVVEAEKVETTINIEDGFYDEIESLMKEDLSDDELYDKLKNILK
jgi:hypothetical protein